MECIRKKCNIIENERVIDVSDINGTLINLRDEKIKDRYATEVLKSRQVLVLLEVKPNIADKTILNYIPLLENKDIITDNFILKLLPKSTKVKTVIQKNSQPTNDKPNMSRRSSNASNPDQINSTRRKSKELKKN